MTGAYYVGLAYIADLLPRASLVLAIVLASLSTAVLAPADRRRFSPYRVSVVPKWEALLSDFRVLKTHEEWDSLWKALEAVEQTSPDKYNALRKGVTYTVLQQSEDGESLLIYRNDYQTFTTEVDFRDDLTPRGSDGMPAQVWPSTDITFFISFGYQDSSLPTPYRGIAGHDLGIDVSDEWWESTRAMCPKPLDEQKDHSTGRIRLTLARISFREFDLYWDPVPWSSDYVNKAAPKIRAIRDEQRKTLGWVSNDYDIPGVYLESIEHKYFSVDHRPI